MEATIYHNPRCSKSREALALLAEGGATARVVEYLKAPPTEAELDALLTKLGVEPAAIVRTGEDRYAELGLKGKDLSRAEWVKVLAANPILIERPIVVVGDRAVIGRPPERVKDLLARS
jgi:arsenate reductase